MAGWGIQPWGLGPWGGGAPPVDTLFLVTNADGGPAILDVKGGTVIIVHGVSFADPIVFELLDGGNNVVGLTYYPFANLDLRPAKAVVGTPALPAGDYTLRVQGSPPESSTLQVSYVRYAEEMKVQRVRGRFAPFWATGERILQ